MEEVTKISPYVFLTTREAARQVPASLFSTKHKGTTKIPVSTVRPHTDRHLFDQRSCTGRSAKREKNAANWVQFNRETQWSRISSTKFKIKASALKVNALIFTVLLQVYGQIT